MLRIGHRTYQFLLLGLVLVVSAFLAVCVALALTIDPPTVRANRLTPAPTLFTQTTVPQPVPSTTTEAETTAAATTTAATPGTTTPVPTPSINITCPANVSIVLGAPYGPTFTGGSAIAAGGCNVGGPIVVYADTLTPDANTTLLQQTLPVTTQVPQALSTVPAARPSMAVGTLQVVVATAGNSSAQIHVYSHSLSTLLVPVFALSTLVPGACNGTSGGGVHASPQVLWDGPAQRWLLMEPTSDHTHLCLYVSVSGDTVGGFMPVPLTLDADGFDTRYAQLALWGNVYTITLGQSRLCVLERGAVLLGDQGAGFFCADALNGPLPAFVLNAWTPLHADGALAPTTQVEIAGATLASGGTPMGAVFMRAIDDELQFGAHTPTTDQLEVEHWYSINFTTSAFGALRYKIAVADFDSSYALCPSIDVCVPTPSAFELDPVRELLGSRLVYRAPSLVAALTSHANGVSLARFYWFELRWTSPQWQLYQQGQSPPSTLDGLHKWLPSPALDVDGNTVILYSASNATQWPSLYAAMRLNSDALGTLRNDTLLLRIGDDAPPSLLASTQWGPASCALGDPLQARTYYVSGAHASNAEAWAVQTSQLLMGGQSVVRNWTAFDYCANPRASCLQTIDQQ